ncbi:hypothetical protein FBULB1_9857 [Fusarium bulbicola]|nr:hypothetical protein FBULB1_9857 [Fusarium bulbicola]
MDPASLSFGIVSLAMQLVQTAKAVKEFIAHNKSAAKELESLADKLDDSETICSSLLGLYVKVSLRRGNFAPLCITLQIPRVIYFEQGQRQIGEKIECAFMDDNLGQIKASSTQGILTPSTVIAWDEYDPDNETSLLGLAALTKAKSILKFLATQTFDPSSRHDSTMSIEGWAGLVADCVSRGLDIHQQLRANTDFSALKDILFYHWDTDEILENVHRWIEILEEAGVNIKEYLMVEMECCFATWRDAPYWINRKVGSSNYRRVLFIKESKGRQFPFWALSVHDECAVKELLTEHEHFAMPLTLYPGGSTQAYIVQHEAWKEHQTLAASDESDRYRKG